MTDNLFIKDRIEAIKVELEAYNEQHLQDVKKNYSINNDIFNKETYDAKVELAKYIHDTYNTSEKLDTLDVNSVPELVLKCLTGADMKRIIALHELKYYKEIPVEMTLSEFAEKAVEILNRYQYRAGGFRIEDSEWQVHTSESKDYDVKSYEVMFENNVNTVDMHDVDTDEYIYYLMKRLKRLATNIRVEFRYKEVKKDRVTWIMIWATDKKAKEIYKKEGKKISL